MGETSWVYNEHTDLCYAVYGSAFTAEEANRFCYNNLNGKLAIMVHILLPPPLQLLFPSYIPSQSSMFFSHWIFSILDLHFLFEFFVLVTGSALTHITDESENAFIYSTLIASHPEENVYWTAGASRDSGFLLSAGSRVTGRERWEIVLSLVSQASPGCGLTVNISPFSTGIQAFHRPSRQRRVLRSRQEAGCQTAAVRDMNSFVPPISWRWTVCTISCLQGSFLAQFPLACHPCESGSSRWLELMVWVDRLWCNKNEKTTPAMWHPRAILWRRFM